MKKQAILREQPARFFLNGEGIDRHVRSLKLVWEWKQNGGVIGIYFGSQDKNIFFPYRSEM